MIEQIADLIEDGQRFSVACATHESARDMFLKVRDALVARGVACRLTAAIRRIDLGSSCAPGVHFLPPPHRAPEAYPVALREEEARPDPVARPRSDVEIRARIDEIYRRREKVCREISDLDAEVRGLVWALNEETPF